MWNTYRIGNAQTIGDYHTQSNYFSTRNDNFVLAVLADGTIDHINGRRCAVLAVEACIREFTVQVQKEEVFPLFDFLAGKTQKEIRDYIYSGKTPSLSLSLLFLKDRELFYYSVGNNRIFLYDGRDYKPFRERSGKVFFGERMTAGMVSGGVHEALPEKEMVSYLKKKEHPFDKAQKMILGVRKKNRKRAGNATVILVEDTL